MGRNHKRVVKETLQKAKELNLQVSFNNYNEHDGFIKPYMTTVTVNNKTINGLQNWDNGRFEVFMALMTEYAHSEITLDQLMNMASEKRIDAIIVKSDGTEVKEYAKDSYRWSQIDLIDRFYRYIDKMSTVENLKQYFELIYKKTQGCCPYANGWTASRVEQVYLTHCIIPSFIRKELKLDINENDLKNLIHDYLYDWTQFSDNLHELIGDVKIKDDLYSKMGLL